MSTPRASRDPDRLARAHVGPPPPPPPTGYARGVTPSVTANVTPTVTFDPAGGLTVTPSVTSELAGAQADKTIAKAWLSNVLPFALAAVWAVCFGYLAIVRHLAGGSSAEDLGFTDQVLWNFLRGQWFRMSLYQGATWNTELDVSRIARPDSLLAFHFEPMLLAFVPIYALGGTATALLAIQAIAVAVGAIPAYRIGRHLAHSTWAGVAVAMAYLLSPLGQWAVLSDFHTSTLAAPLLMLCVERLLVARNSAQALIVAAIAASAREDVGPVLAVLGIVILLIKQQRQEHKRAGVVLVAMGVTTTALATLVIRDYSGGTLPFDVRYGQTLGAGLQPTLQALLRPTVLEYAQTLLLSGAWLGLLQPLFLLPALPTLAINVLSTSPWMAAGKAHYSALVLPFIVIAAALALGWLRSRSERLQTVASGALVLTSLVGYANAGAGPFAPNFASAEITAHAEKAAALAASIPVREAVSASAALVPRLSERPRIYVFPAIEDADTVFVDLKASPAPTSAGDVFLRLNNLLHDGGWRLEAADDGLMLLRHEDVSTTATAHDAASAVSEATDTTTSAEATLVDAAMIPSPIGAIGLDGPHWILRTRWRTDHAIPAGTRLEFNVELADGEQLHLWDVADLWWNPPERWASGQAITVDVPDIPIRQFSSWSAVWVKP